MKTSFCKEVYKDTLVVGTPATSGNPYVPSKLIIDAFSKDFPTNCKNFAFIPQTQFYKKVAANVSSLLGMSLYEEICWGLLEKI